MGNAGENAYLFRLTHLTPILQDLNLVFTDHWSSHLCGPFITVSGSLAELQEEALWEAGQ